MSPPPPASRRAGILVPLFSIPTARSWGIGEIADIEPLTRWLASAGQRIAQFLPINEMPPGESSPYSALSAMAIDPQFITLDLLEDFRASGGDSRLEPGQQNRLAASRAHGRIDYAAVRSLKDAALRQAFAWFRNHDSPADAPRARAFRDYMDAQAWWLEDYALFRAIHASQGERPWTEWPGGLRDRDPAALEAAREALEADVLFRKYLQWVADEQWRTARRSVHGVALFGDLPFMVAGDSADVWSRQHEFRLDASIGVPPDAFSDTGQDWGLPVYRWDAMANGDFAWLRARARRNAELFDGYRVDHLVGFYRTYFRPHDGGAPAFVPADPAEQLALGERVLDIFRSAGAEIIAEDLGTVPDFVRESLLRLGVPGCKVFRWEREWDTEGQPFRDPAFYPEASMATSGTHDTDAMATWWGTTPEDRAAVLAIPSVREALTDTDVAEALESQALTPAAHKALLAALYKSASMLVLLPIQDVFGWTDRINQPGTVSDANWTWTLPLAVDCLPQDVAERLKTWTEAGSR